MDFFNEVAVLQPETGRTSVFLPMKSILHGNLELTKNRAPYRITFLSPSRLAVSPSLDPLPLPGPPWLFLGPAPSERSRATEKKKPSFQPAGLPNFVMVEPRSSLRSIQGHCIRLFGTWREVFRVSFFFTPFLGSSKKSGGSTASRLADKTLMCKINGSAVSTGAPLEFSLTVLT